MASTLTPEEQELHLNRITGSTVAAILGYSQWETPFSAWLQITGQEESGEEESPDIALGVLLEPALVAYAGGLLGVGYEKVKTMVDAGRPWMAATPDAVLADRRGLEVKNRNHHMSQFFKGLPEEAEWGNDLVPVADNMQCQWGMAVTGFEEWVFCVYFGGRAFRMYRIRRDEKLLKAMIEAAYGWWKQHIDPEGPREMPDPDGRPPTREALTRMFTPAEPDKIPATPEHVEIARTIRELDNRAKELQESRAQLANRLAVDIGYHSGIEGVCSFPLIQPKARTDWKALAQSAPDWREREAQFTTPTKAYRKLTLSKDLDDE